jgi:integrase
MSALARRYLSLRRKLGFVLRREGAQVINFARFADRVAPRQPITSALALQWATLPQTTHQRFYHAKRLESLRAFARYCAIFEPRTEVPSTRLVGPAHRRLTPHIYSSGQVRLLLQRAAALPVVHPSDPLRALTYVTLIGLIACTGMRMGEALRLTEADFDDAAGTLRVARAKFSPARLLPLHSSAVRALRRYRSARRRHPVFTNRLFAGRGGRPLNQNTVYYTFRGITRDFVVTGARAYPRFHDFRHTLVTRLIAQWSRQKSSVAHHLLLLSRYLGHRTFGETFWYVSADPLALKTISQRFNRYCHAQPLRTHDSDPIPVPDPEVFRRPPDHPAQCQPANRRRLPRYLPAAAAISLRLPSPPR